MSRMRITPASNLQYIRRVLEFSDNLVAYWPGNVRSGTTLYNKAPLTDVDGSLSGVTLGVEGIGDGLTALGFDGSTSYGDISAIASNEIANGGFETAGGGGADVHAEWTENAGDGAIANEATNIHTGADALKLTAGASADTYDDQTITVEAGETYDLGIYTRGDGSNAGRYQVYDVSNSADIIALKSTGVTATSYAEVDDEFTAPAGCTSVRVRLQCPTTDTGVAYFDTVSVRNVNSFDPHEGTVIGWGLTDAWADGNTRDILHIKVDTANEIRITKINPNILQFTYDGGGATNFYQHTMSPPDWFTYGMTFSLSGDSVQYYVRTYDSGFSNVGSDSGLSAWVGQLNATDNVIGAQNTSPATPWDGSLAHPLISNVAWDADTMAYLMRKP